MVMLTALVCSLKLGDILAELVFYHQVTVQQEVDGIIQGGATNPVILVLHEDVKRFDIEMAAARIYLIQDRKALRSLPVPFLFQVLCEDLLYCLPGFVTDHRSLPVKYLK